MRVSLAGLIDQAACACAKGDKTYGRMYGFTLKELEKHIKELVAGQHTLEEFARFYCIEPKAEGEKE